MKNIKLKEGQKVLDTDGNEYLIEKGDILKEELHVFSAKELLSSSFLKKVSKVAEKALHDLFTGNKSYEGTGEDRILTSDGFIALQRILNGYIANYLNMGYNIAQQSLDNLDDTDWEDILNTLEILNKWKPSSGISF